MRYIQIIRSSHLLLFSYHNTGFVCACVCNTKAKHKQLVHMCPLLTVWGPLPTIWQVLTQFLTCRDKLHARISGLPSRIRLRAVFEKWKGKEPNLFGKTCFRLCTLALRAASKRINSRFKTELPP